MSLWGEADPGAVDPKKDRIRVAQGSEGEVDIFSDKEIEALMFHAYDSKRASQRDQVILLILNYTGIRVGELVGIKLRDIDCIGLSLMIPWGKGGKVREVPLKVEVVEGIRAYLDGERKESIYKNSEYLLLSQRSGKMDRDTVNKALKRIGKELRFPVWPHKFRHTFCTRLLNRNVPLTTVARLAGHASIQTTASYYINTSRQDKREAVELL